MPVRLTFHLSNGERVWGIFPDAEGCQKYLTEVVHGPSPDRPRVLELGSEFGDVVVLNLVWLAYVTRKEEPE